MTMEQIIEAVREFDGVLVVTPGPGDGLPELSWGDAFIYYAPDGQMPRNVQPYATIVTKDYPGDTASDLDPDGRWRLNIHVGRAAFTRLTGEDPAKLTRAHDCLTWAHDCLTRAHDWAAADEVVPHPVYGSLGWVAVVNPGEATSDTVAQLLWDAHVAARARYERRCTAG